MSKEHTPEPQADVEGLDPLAFNLASQRLNEAKEAIFASEWSEKQQEMLADFAEAAADLLEMVKAAYLGRSLPIKDKE